MASALAAPGTAAPAAHATAEGEFAAFDSDSFNALEFVNQLFPNGAPRAAARL